MALTYIHLSDIHFGQEKGPEVYVHDDVKECLIEDIATLKVTAGIERMDGVIVTGDVAFLAPGALGQRGLRGSGLAPIDKGTEIAKLAIAAPDFETVEVSLVAGADVGRAGAFGRFGAAISHMPWGPER